MKQLLLTVLSLWLFAACKKADFLRYDTSNKADIYFDNHTVEDYNYWNLYFDTARISFGSRPDVTQDSVLLGVRISGDTTATDRAFSLVVDKNASSAVAGRDYQLPDNNSLVIRRDSIGAKFYVKIFKSAAILDTPLTLVLKLMPNNHFDTLITQQKEQYLYNNVILNATRFRITIDNIIPEPDYWKNYVNFLGSYSQQKYLLLLKVNGLTLTDAIGNLSVTYFKGIASKVQAYLNQQAAAGNTILEKDGSPMVMGPDAQ